MECYAESVTISSFLSAVFQQCAWRNLWRFVGRPNRGSVLEHGQHTISNEKVLVGLAIFGVKNQIQATVSRHF